MASNVVNAAFEAILFSLIHELGMQNLNFEVYIMAVKKLSLLPSKSFI